MEGSEIVNYGDTICVVGGFDEVTKMARKSVSCWNPLQIGSAEDDEENADGDAAENKTVTVKGITVNNFIKSVFLRWEPFWQGIGVVWGLTYC